MTIFSISDLHLSSGDKPMDVFGANWTRHFERISADWRERVTEEDVVLLPGDISWEMQLEEAKPQLREISALPGRKIMIKGNHDYWWSSIGRVREALPRGFFAIQNDCVALDGALFCGTRGWQMPGADATAQDEKIYRREALRLEMTLRAARALSGEMPLYVMTHYPPLTDQTRDTPFSRLLTEYGADQAVYGHLHGLALKNAFTGEYGGVRYRCVSCDGLDFQLFRLTSC